MVAEKVFATRVQTANELAEERDDIILSDESGAFPFNGLPTDLPLSTLCTDTADMKEVVSDQDKVAIGKMKASYDRQAKDWQYLRVCLCDYLTVCWYMLAFNSGL